MRSVVLFVAAFFLYTYIYAVETFELRFDKSYKIEPKNFSKKFQSSKISKSGVTATWIKIESLDSLKLKDLCVGSGKIIRLMSNPELLGCFKNSQITFQTQAYKEISYYNIHTFDFKNKIAQDQIISFFKEMKYVQE